jgi:hypothetical protein
MSINKYIGSIKNMIMLTTMQLNKKTHGSKDIMFMINSLTQKMVLLFFIYVEKLNVMVFLIHLTQLKLQNKQVQLFFLFNIDFMVNLCPF